MSWYRFSQNLNDIKKIAEGVRYSLTNNEKDSLKALCLPASRHLCYILMKKGYSAANVVQGTFRIDEPDPEAYSEWDVNDFIGDSFDEEEAMNQAYEEMEAAKYTPLHYWVQINDIIIDITPDQFNDELEYDFPSVYIANKNSPESSRYTTIIEDYIEPKLMW